MTEAEPAKPEAETPETAETAPVPAPVFDEVRREADGMTVIAGKGAPGAVIAVLQDGVEIARASADAAGKFATIALIPPDGQGHVLTLLQTVEGQEVMSDGEIILAPLAAPIVVAEAGTTPAADPAPEAPAIHVAPAEGTTPQPAEVPVVTAEATEEPATQAQPAAATEVAPVSTETQAETPATETVAAKPVQTASPEAAPATETASASPAESVVVARAEPEPQTPAPVAVLRSTSEGVELLNTPAPEVMDNVAIDTISYSDAGDVQLSGRAQIAAAAVRVYLDNVVVANLPVDDQGRWRGDLPNVDAGIYTLRVDELSEDGKITSRVETPFKREAPEVLAAAAAGHDGPLREITVQKGATLWAIARDRYGDGLLYVRVFEANRQSIRNPDLIYPGQIFDLPD